MELPTTTPFAQYLYAGHDPASPNNTNLDQNSRDAQMLDAIQQDAFRRFNTECGKSASEVVAPHRREVTQSILPSRERKIIQELQDVNAAMLRREEARTGRAKGYANQDSLVKYKGI